MIIRTARDWCRSALFFDPFVFRGLTPGPDYATTELQRTATAVTGQQWDPSNFRRYLGQLPMFASAGTAQRAGRGRPAVTWKITDPESD